MSIQTIGTIVWTLEQIQQVCDVPGCFANNYSNLAYPYSFQLLCSKFSRFIMKLSSVLFKFYSTSAFHFFGCPIPYVTFEIYNLFHKISTFSKALREATNFTLLAARVFVSFLVSPTQCFPFLHWVRSTQHPIRSTHRFWKWDPSGSLPHRFFTLFQFNPDSIRSKVANFGDQYFNLPNKRNPEALPLKNYLPIFLWPPIAILPVKCLFVLLPVKQLLLLFGLNKRQCQNFRVVAFYLRVKRFVLIFEADLCGRIISFNSFPTLRKNHVIRLVSFLNFVYSSW